MAHECPECGQMCYCDGEDTFVKTADKYCIHCPELCGPDCDCKEKEADGQ